MTVSEVKKRLRGIRQIRRHVRVLEEHREVLESKITRTTPVSEITGIHGSTAASDRMSEYVADLEQTDSEIGKLQHEIRQAATVINSLDYAPYKAVLFCYYIDGLDWDSVAEIVHYSRRQVLNLHGRALIALADDCTKLHF